jgi:hypothetical protein
VRTSRLFHCLSIILAVLTGFAGFLPMPSARAQIPQGITYVTTATYAKTTQNWSQVIASGAHNLTAGTPASLPLAAGYVGVDVSSNMGYQVLLCGSFSSTTGVCTDPTGEAVTVTGGNYATSSGGTINFTPFFSHGQSAAYTVASASSGIQETINTACGVSNTYYNNVQCNVTIPGNGPYIAPNESTFSINNYNVYGTIFLHSTQSSLSGPGVVLNCLGRGPCVQVGVLGTSSTHFGQNQIESLGFRAGVVYSVESSAYAGVNITNTAGNGTYRLITTSTAHNFRQGDLVTIMFTDNNAFWGDAVIYDCATTISGSFTGCTNSSTTFRYSAGMSITSAATPGVVALAYTAILDNGFSTEMNNIWLDINGGAGEFNNVFDIWDDENATISHYNNQGAGINASGTWTASHVFSGGAQNVTGEQLAPVITLRDSTLTADFSNCVTVYNSNGLYLDNDVCQSTGLWEFYIANTTGNYQGGNLRNIYNNGSSCCTLNPGPPANPRTPFPGLGGSGAIFGPATSAAHNTIKDGVELLGTSRLAEREAPMNFPISSLRTV